MAPSRTGVILILLFWIRTSQQAAVQKNHTACHSTSRCGLTEMTCGTGQRLAFADARHAHPAVGTNFDMPCPVQATNCSQVPEFCCGQSANNETDACFQSYDQATLLEVHRKCSGFEFTSEGNASCNVRLPSVPQVDSLSGQCDNASQYQNLSRYSVVDYACIDNSDISFFCSPSERTGHRLYTMWTPDNITALGRLNSPSCTCTVTSTEPGKVLVFVKILDLRLPSPGAGGNCSYLRVGDASNVRYQSPCNKSTVLFDPDLNFSQDISARTPFDISLLLHEQHVPEFVWLGFSGVTTGMLKVTCYDMKEAVANSGNGGNSGPVVESPEEEGHDAGAVIGGTIGGLVVILIVAFICIYIYSRRKNDQAPKTEQSWWEKIREEDRVSGKSQLGLTRTIVLDDGRNMGYGKHRPTQRKYDLSTHNEAIYIVPGTAVPPERIIELPDDYDEGGNAGGGDDAASTSGHHPPSSVGAASDRYQPDALQSAPARHWLHAESDSDSHRSGSTRNDSDSHWPDVTEQGKVTVLVHCENGAGEPSAWYTNT